MAEVPQIGDTERAEEPGQGCESRENEAAVDKTMKGHIGPTGTTGKVTGGPMGQKIDPRGQQRAPDQDQSEEKEN